MPPRSTPRTRWPRCPSSAPGCRAPRTTDCLARLSALFGGRRSRARRQVRPAPPPQVPEPVWVPRRPARERQSGGPGGTLSALVFLFVTLTLCGGLAYGFQWAVGTQGGLLSGAFGAVIATPSPTPNRGALKLATPTATAEGGAASAAQTPEA